MIAVCVQGEWGWHEPKPLGHVELMVFGGFSSTKKGSERAPPELWFSARGQECGDYYNDYAAVAALAGASFENVANMTRPDPCAA